MRLEIKADIQVALQTVAQSQGRLEKKFDDLEAGRLTRLEGKYNDLAIRLVEAEGNNKTAEATISAKVAILFTMAVVAGSAILNIVIARIFK